MSDGYRGIDWCNSRIEELKRERDRLKKAIERHQAQKWMPGHIPNNRHDKELYAALQEDGDE